MKSFWTYITTLFAGIIAGLMIFLKIDGPNTVINDTTHIAKMKQRGNGNTATTSINPERSTTDEPQNSPGRKEARLLKRLNRIRKHQIGKES